MKIKLKALLSIVILNSFTATSLVSSQVMSKKDNCDKTIIETNPTITNTNSNRMISSTGFILHISQFIARDDHSLPTGIIRQANRDIGRATIFVSLENHQKISQTFIIQNIEIRNSSNNFVQPFVFEPKQIELKPLENSVIDVHLTNKTGYVGQDRVKAIVTYKIGDQVNVIESKVVDVDRH
jgi:hypothetical protein